MNNSVTLIYRRLRDCGRIDGRSVCLPTTLVGGQLGIKRRRNETSKLWLIALRLPRPKLQSKALESHKLHTFDLDPPSYFQIKEEIFVEIYDL
jgi:hypothetical protein